MAGTFADFGTLPTSGPAGVDFKFRQSIGVGDADRNGQVRNGDLNLVRNNLFIDLGQGGYGIFTDIDGNGQTRNADLNQVRNQLFVDPPAGPGPNRPDRARRPTTSETSDAHRGGRRLLVLSSAPEDRSFATRRNCKPAAADLLDVLYSE